MEPIQRLSALVASALIVLSACTLVPNMDETGSGCANRVGIGPRDLGDAPPGVPVDGIAGLRPVEAAAAATAMGHTVVFREDALHCVCVPPTGFGPVSHGWFGERGQLYLDLEDVTPKGQLLSDGAGCG
jgi:hypothetical protein